MSYPERKSRFGCTCSDWLFQCFNRCDDPEHIGIAQGDVHAKRARVWMRGSFYFVSLSDAAKCAQRLL